MLLWQGNLMSQVTPNEGEVQCLLAGSGATFTDFGGLGGDNAVEGAPGNYLNCDCVTTTTICTPDGSALTAEITSFGIFSPFDWLVILDIDNPANVAFPATITDDPMNAALQLFNNADGIGDGNSEAYGPGAEVNQGIFAALTNTTFTATNPSGCLTFVFRASGVVDDSGWDITTTAASGVGHPGDNLPCGTNVDCFPPGNVAISNILGSSADVTWDAAMDATSYTLEYGLVGFTPGTGTTITTSDLSVALTGLEQLTNYSVYIQADCGADGLSFNLGPIMFMTDLTCPPPSDLTLDNITAGSVDVSWTAAPTATSYIVEYGPAGFTPGTGMTVTTTDVTATITGLDEITQYDVYVIGDCGATDGMSPAVGPANFMTPFINPPQSCSYTLNLFDSFGDGWNGSILTVTHNGVSTDYTFTTGNEAFFDFDVFEGLPIILTYTAGAFQNEVTYELVDPDGLVAFSDGPNPGVGEVFNENAICPDCPVLDSDLIDFTNITFESATMNWMGIDSALTYTLEWGLSGFTFGSGNVENTAETTFDFTNLMENTIYDVYIFGNCPAGDGQPLGPFSFQTGFVDPPSMCNYLLELNDTGFGNAGWDGSTVSITINNITTEYTLNGVDDDGVNATFAIPVLAGFDIVVGYTQVGFGGFNHDYTLSDSDGIPLFMDSANPAQGDNVFTAIAVCPDCPAASPPSNFQVLAVSDTTANLSWTPVMEAMNYIIEYGPTGFPFGFGLTSTTENPLIELEGLNPCVTYDAYVTVDCGGDGVSTTIGPITFTTTYSVPPGAPGDTCTYSLDLMDTFGDGWNGSVLNITHDGATTPYTLDNVNDDGSQAIFDLPFVGNLPVVLDYTAGAFQNEVIYDLIDPDGNVIFSDGPFPAVGEVYDFVACPSCPGPIDGSMLDVNADNATVGWTSPSGATGSYIVEWGTLGFTLGTGSTQTVGSAATSSLLNGLAENTWYDVYITLDCGTENSKPFGPISFQTIWLNDVGIGIITNPTSDSCNLTANEDITVGLTNFGQNPQSLFEYFFAVNGELAPVSPPSDGFFTGVVGNDSTLLVDFETTWDFSVPGLYVIEAWTNLDGDSDSSNDTLRIEIVTALPLPLIEDFEESVVPEGWTTDGFIFADGAHNNETVVLGRNLFVAGSTFTTTTERYGPINDGDSLSFDYRYTVWSAGTIGLDIGTNTLEVQVSEDCGDTWTTIFTVDESNHVTSADAATRFVDLSPYAGAALNFRFVGIHGDSDYWLDLDNINVLGCPPSLGLMANVNNPTIGVGDDGSIAVDPMFGTAPYDYEWNTNDNTATISDLPAGEYFVTVTDALGCQDIRVYNLEEVVSSTEVSAIDELILSPNPTSGLATLSIEMNRAVDVDIQVFNVAGQIIQTASESQTTQLSQDFDLSNEASGMYFVRVMIEGQSHYERLILTK